MSVTVHHGDSREVLKGIVDASIDSCVSDPPYALTSIVKRFANSPRNEKTENLCNPYGRTGAGFMGQKWDTGETAFSVEFWREVLRVLKPGGHLIAFGGTRTYHRLACAIEDAGFEIRDQIGWLYGSGFPKSHKLHGQWEGWGTALKPAWEPIVLARKPLIGTVAANVLVHGTGAINIDKCRVPSDDNLRAGAGILPVRHHPEVPRGRQGEASADRRYARRGGTDFAASPGPRGGDEKGRFPANIIHDCSDEVVAAFPETPGQQRVVGPEHGPKSSVNVYGDFGPRETFRPRDDAGSAARFFYSAKADKDDRLGSKHPTVKPIDLMAYLCRLVTPPGGTVLDPFAGSGTTGMACLREGFNAILVEREAKFVEDIKRRIAHVSGNDTPLFAGDAA